MCTVYSLRITTALTCTLMSPYKVLRTHTLDSYDKSAEKNTPSTLTFGNGFYRQRPLCLSFSSLFRVQPYQGLCLDEIRIRIRMDPHPTGSLNPKQREKSTCTTCNSMKYSL